MRTRTIEGRCPYCSQPGSSCPHGYRRKPGNGGIWIWPLIAILGGVSALIKIVAHHPAAALAWTAVGLGFALLVLVIIYLNSRES